jgi:hypothetical protein
MGGGCLSSPRILIHGGEKGDKMICDGCVHLHTKDDGNFCASMIRAMALFGPGEIKRDDLKIPLDLELCHFKE